MKNPTAARTLAITRPVASAAAVVATTATMVPQTERAGPHGCRRRHRVSRAVELADDDQEEQLVQLTDRLRERGLSFLGGARTRQHHLEIPKDATLVGQQPFLIVGQNSLHGRPRANP